MSPTHTFHIKQCHNELIKARCPFYDISDTYCTYEQRTIPNPEKPRCKVISITIEEDNVPDFI